MHTPVKGSMLLPLLRKDEFLSRAVRADPALDPGTLTETWQQSRASMRRLSDAEPDQADAAAILPIPAGMQPQIESVMRSRQVVRAFSTAPVAFGLADIEALMASRDTLYQDQLAFWHQQALDKWMEDAALAALCLPADASARRPEALLEGNTWRLRSEDPALTVRLAPGVGPTDGTASLELVIAAPPPLVHAARLDGRLLLLDGHHRARALGGLGVRYLPCIISACEDLEDLYQVAPWLDRDTLRKWFASPRPPLLRDFNRRSLAYTGLVHRREWLLEVSVDVRRIGLP